MTLNVFLIMLAEDLTLWDSIWLTMTTISTVGYGDLAAKTFFGQMVTIILIYICGIFMLAQIAGEWIDYRFDRRERMRKGLWRWKMSGHIVVINVPVQNGERYLKILVGQIRNTNTLEHLPIQIVSDGFPDGLPADIAAEGVVLHQDLLEGGQDFSEVDIEKAVYILVLALDTNNFRSDSVTLDILDRLKSFNLKAHIIAECIQDANRQRLRDHGADAVIRPVRAYPELMVRTMAAPGTEVILEDLFRHEGVHPHRYDVDFHQQQWGGLATRLITSGLGTPLGYLDESGNVITNPPSEITVTGKALFLMVYHHKIPAESEVQHCVNNQT